MLVSSTAGVVAFLGVLVGGVSFGVTGFAFALFATAALALSSSPQVFVPAVMLLADTLALPLLWEHRRYLRRDHLRTVPPFAPYSFPLLLVGIAAGTLLLGRVTPAAGRLALAAVLLGFVGFQALRAGAVMGTPRTEPKGAAAGAAFGGGLLDAWLGTGGPVIVVYLTWKRFAPGDFLVAVLAYFLLADVVRAVGYGAAGFWTRASLELYLQMLPIALAGYAGGVLLRRSFVSPAVFQTVVLVLLTVLALALIRGALAEG